MLNEGGKEVPKLCLGFLFLEFFKVIDVQARVIRFFAAAEKLVKRGATSPSSLHT